MRDVKETLLPNEKIQFQYAYQLWLKILVVAMLLAVVWLLYDDIRAARYLFVVFEVGIGFYVVKWLVQMLRDNDQYIVTDQRVMRLGSNPAADLVILFPEISEVRLERDTFSGSGSVQVIAKDGRVIKVPMPNTVRSKAEKLIEKINQYRGVDPAVVGQIGPGKESQ